MTAVPEWVVESRRAQGLPLHVEDEAALARVALMLTPELEVAA